jgi:hypothetical protein
VLTSVTLTSAAASAGLDPVGTLGAATAEQMDGWLDQVKPRLFACS